MHGGVDSSELPCGDVPHMQLRRVRRARRHRCRLPCGEAGVGMLTEILVSPRAGVDNNTLAVHKFVDPSPLVRAYGRMGIHHATRNIAIFKN